jgi:hypothetical protein
MMNRLIDKEKNSSLAYLMRKLAKKRERKSNLFNF